MKSEDYMLPCLNKKMFGFDCPGCGLQRSVVHLTKGEVKQAYNMYPPVFSLLLLLAFIFLNLKYKFKNGIKIIIILAVVNTLVILINYYFKMTELYKL